MAVGVPDFFFACGWIGLLIFLRNEKKQCAKCAGIAKSVTEKNNSRVDCAEAPKKTVQAMRYEWWGFFGAGGFCPAELSVINFPAKPDRLNWQTLRTKKTFNFLVLQPYFNSFLDLFKYAEVRKMGLC